MKVNLILGNSGAEKMLLYPFRGKKLRILKRLSPFLLVSLSLIFLFFYTLITSDKVVSTRLIYLPFIIANILLVDVAIWNYMEGRRWWLIWGIESVFSLVIVYWLS